MSKLILDGYKASTFEEVQVLSTLLEAELMFRIEPVALTYY